MGLGPGNIDFLGEMASSRQGVPFGAQMNSVQCRKLK
jgi:hypothetical protein